MRVTRLLSLRVWVNSVELDHRIANGCPPSLSAHLELRTLQLASARCRWALARDLEAIVAEAGRPMDLCTSAVPIRRSAILAARDELLELAATLTDPSCNNVRGVALASCLLRDPLGPLYIDSHESLGDAADAATMSLRAAI